MNYQIADFLIRIKNASKAGRHDVALPFSNVNKNIGKVLVSEKFLATIKEVDQKGKKGLVATVAYADRLPVMTDVTIVSKPSLRVYLTSKKIAAESRKGREVLVLSTSKGVMTGKEAQKKGLGGELLFKIW